MISGESVDDWSGRELRANQSVIGELCRKFSFLNKISNQEETRHETKVKNSQEIETISLQRPFSCFLFKHSLIIPFRCSLTLIVKLLTCKFNYLDCNLHAAFVTNENLQVSRKCISKCTDVPPSPTAHPLICGNTIRSSFLECVPIKIVIKLS